MPVLTARAGVGMIVVGRVFAAVLVLGGVIMRMIVRVVGSIGLLACVGRHRVCLTSPGARMCPTNGTPSDEPARAILPLEFTTDGTAQR